MTIQTETIGYPRIGKNREVKKALEAFWSGKLDGLKTRRWEEVVPALKNMVAATKKLREELNATRV